MNVVGERELGRGSLDFFAYRRHWILLPLFAATVFLNAALLFAVEPLVAKMILPKLGGTPAVWNTCMVFYQAVLLGGYACAHASSTWLNVRRQSALLVILQLVVFLVLPIHLGANVNSSVPHESNPIPWLLGLMLVVVGLPFFVVAMTGPLLQRWFSATAHREAHDPYFLYGPSNLGSIIALLSYPLFVEPKWGLADQAWLWAVGYGVVVFFTFTIAVLLRRPGVVVPTAEHALDGPTPGARSRGRRLRWIVLAFIPSSMMLGVTTYLTTNIATIPLLWVLPLALYLLSFILVFGRKTLVPHRLVQRALPIAILLLCVALLADDMEPPVLLLIGLHLGAFFIAALFCHGELARDRPEPRYLTEFYFWLALGGVLGGLFNGLVAPLIFNRVVEYPLILVLLSLVRRPTRHTVPKPWSRRFDYALPLALGAMTAGVVWGLQDRHLDPPQLRVALMFGVPAVLCYMLVDRPLRFALGVAALLLAGSLYTGEHGRPLHTERSFFGVLRITLDPTATLRQLVHGNTVHGRQRIDSESPPEPLAYYHRSGPIGQFFEALGPRLANGRIAVVGLGVGSMAAYATPRQEWTFYEIDPAVYRIASNPAFFSFLENCRAAKLEVLLGDARLRLEEAPNRYYDLIVLDAFSSDAVPVHLLTREALNLYLAKSTDHGLLAFHISNRYLDLKPVIANLARDAEDLDLEPIPGNGNRCGLVCRCREDLDVTPDEKAAGKSPSQWVVLARSTADLGKLAKSIRWHPLDQRPDLPVWRDDFSNLLGVFRWRDWGVD
jgi:hypothetical protein